jgi:hypothetical protein
MPYYFLAKDYDALIATIEALMAGSSVAACAGGHCMNRAPAARHSRGHHRPRSPDLPSLATAERRPERSSVALLGPTTGKPLRAGVRCQRPSG